MTDHERLMAVAIEQAKLGAAGGEQPFGAVVARNGEVFVKAHSLKVSRCDCTAHSETLAIGMATKKACQRSLSAEFVFYCTCEPCPMCCGAVLNSGIRTMVIGARNRDVARLVTGNLDYNEYTVERFARMVGWDLAIIDGVLGAECLALYTGAAIEITR